VIEYADPDMESAPPVLPAPAAPAARAEAPLVDRQIERWLPVVVSVGLPVLITISAAVSGWGATTSAGLLVGLGGLALGILLAVAQVVLVMTANVITALFAVVAHLIRLTALTVRNVWNWCATVDPRGGRPVRPMPEGPHETILKGLEDGKARIEAISAAYRRQVFEQFFSPRKEARDDESEEGHEPEAASVGLAEGAHQHHANGGESGLA